MKLNTLFPILFFTVILQSCKGQETESFWRAEYVKKIDGKPIDDGIRSAYMTMIVDMKLYLSKKNDSIFLINPNEKKMKISELTSISNVRSKGKNKELLDNVYDVRKNNDSLQIMFYFGGRKESDRYILSFSSIDKKNFLNETQKLKKEKKQLFKMLKTVDCSAIDLAIQKPDYFNKDIKLNTLNPIQLAEMISVDNDGFQTSVSHVSFNLKSKGLRQYSEYYLQGSEKLNFNAAVIGKVNFNTIKMVSNDINDKTNAIIITQKNLKNDEIKELFTNINSKIGNVKINEGNTFNLEISWFDANKTVKMIITNVADITDSTDEILTQINTLQNSISVENILHQYLSTVKKSETKVTIVSNELLKIVQTDEFKNRVGGMPFIVDYNQ